MFAEENSSNYTKKGMFGKSKNKTLDHKFHFKALKDQCFMKPSRPNGHFSFLQMTQNSLKGCLLKKTLPTPH